MTGLEKSQVPHTFKIFRNTILKYKFNIPIRDGAAYTQFSTNL